MENDIKLLLQVLSAVLCEEDVDFEDKFKVDRLAREYQIDEIFWTSDA